MMPWRPLATTSGKLSTSWNASMTLASSALVKPRNWVAAPTAPA